MYYMDMDQHVPCLFAVRAVTELNCIESLSSVNDEEQKGISLSDRNDEKPT
jgi:hypothetical protein